MTRCQRCDDPLHPERAEYGWLFCVRCVDDDWRLIDRPAVVIHTSHKQGPMVVRPDCYEATSAYNR